MDDTNNIYSLFMAPDEASAQEKAAALQSALRTRRSDFDGMRSVGNLGLLTGDPVLGHFGQLQLQDAQKEGEELTKREHMMADAGQARLQSATDLMKMKSASRVKPDELRKELLGNTVAKNTQQLAEARTKIEAAYHNPSATGDISMVYGLMKIFDPGSTVREGEFATAEQAGGVPAHFLNLYNKVVNGQRLPQSVRDDFMKQANTLYRAQYGRYQPLANEYGRLAEENGIARNDVVLDLGLAPPTEPRASAAKQTPDVMMVGQTKYRRQPDGTYLPE
jgi:hypothetical protein